MKKIFLTGCAKSGTTLVRRLFNAFKDLNIYNYNEIKVEDFIVSDYNVGKRANGPFSAGVMSDDTIQHYFNLLQNSHIINIIRNKEDVLKSDNGWVDAIRYDACIKQAEDYSDKIAYTIMYEELLKSPNNIQEEIAEKFNLDMAYKWSEYPSFMDGIKEKPQTQGGIYKLRAIGAKK